MRRESEVGSGPGRQLPVRLVALLHRRPDRPRHAPKLGNDRVEPRGNLLQMWFGVLKESLQAGTQVIEAGLSI